MLGILQQTERGINVINTVILSSKIEKKLKNVRIWNFSNCYDNYGGVSNHKFSYGNNYSQLKRPVIFYAF